MHSLLSTYRRPLWRSGARTALLPIQGPLRESPLYSSKVQVRLLGAEEYYFYPFFLSFLYKQCIANLDTVLVHPGSTKDIHLMINSQKSAMAQLDSAHRTTYPVTS